MTSLYIVRHGETEWNKSNKIQGKIDTDLSEVGIIQAKLLAKRLLNENIKFIYTSSLKRAKQTAEIIADYINCSYYEADEYQEIGLGPWEGLTIKEIKERYSEHYKAYRESPADFVLSGAETFEELGQRTYNAILEIVRNNKEKNILLVSHGTAIKAAIMKILDIDMSLYNRFSIDNASISIVSFRDDYYGGVVVKMLNDTCHLKGDEMLEI